MLNYPVIMRYLLFSKVDNVVVNSSMKCLQYLGTQQIFQVHRILHLLIVYLNLYTKVIFITIC